ncbi:MAG: hypothetical protein ABI455_04395, partial [Candidatus Dormiibacterota bacterium]
MLATQDLQPSSASFLSDDELMVRMRSTRHLIDLQELSFAEDAAEFASRNAWDDEGSASAIDWMRFNCHMTSGAAANSVAVGETMSRVPESTQAAFDREVGYSHLVALARTARAVGDRFDEKALLEKARENSPGKFHFICNHYRHAADPKGYAAEQTEQVEQRELRLSTWMDGSLLISGILDSIGGAALRSALEP